MQPSWQLSRAMVISARSRHLVGEPVPEPARDALQRRRLEAGDVVEEPMVELFPRLRHRARQLLEVHDEPRLDRVRRRR